MNNSALPIELQLVDDGPLYVAQKKVYPQSVSGTFRRIKWGLMTFCLGVYYLLPFVRWNRGLGAPDQAVLVDLPNSRFYFFFITVSQASMHRPHWMQSSCAPSRISMPVGHTATH